MSVRFIAGLVVATTVSAPAIARSQTTSTAPLQNGWRDGFVLQSEAGDYRLQFNALLQSDGRFALDDQADALVDTFAFRRVRPYLQGRIARYFDFAVTPDFAGGAVNLRNVYIETRFSPAFRVRFGKDKVPFGLERLQSASSLLFVERALPTTVAPDRDIGVQIIGDVAAGMVSYAAGVFNGVIDGGSADSDSNDGKDIAGRVIVRPFNRAPQHPLAGLGLGIAGTRGAQPAVLPSFRTSGQQIFFAYARTAAGEGNRRRVSPQVSYYYKSLGAFGEYVRSIGRISSGGVSADVVHESWQFAGSIVVTGEPASDRGARPVHPFDPGKREWGALQLAARYSAFEIDSRATALGLAGSGARRARAVAVGANWYLNPFVKWVLNLERTAFDGAVNGSLPAEIVLLIRNQISF